MSDADGYGTYRVVDAGTPEMRIERIPSAEYQREYDAMMKWATPVVRQLIDQRLFYTKRREWWLD